MARRKGGISRKTSRKRGSKKGFSERQSMGKDAESEALAENERNAREAEGLDRDERLTRGYQAPGAGA